MIHAGYTAVAAGALLFFAPLSENYSNKKCTPDSTSPGHCIGDLGAAYDTGQVRYVPNYQYADSIHYSPGSALQIVDNKLTNKTTDPKGGAGYTIANIGKQVSQIGGTFVFKPGTGGGLGAASFIVWNGFSTFPYPPDTGFHLSIGRSTWELRVVINDQQPFPPFVPSQNVFPVIASGGYNNHNNSAVLANDGTTVYSFSATFSATTVTMDLHGSDGTQLLPSPVVQLNPGNLSPPPPPIGNYPCWEVYQADASAGPAGDDKAAFISIFAN